MVLDESCKLDDIANKLAGRELSGAQIADICSQVIYLNSHESKNDDLFVLFFSVDLILSRVWRSRER